MNNTDKLFALKAFEKRVKAEREELEAGVRQELLEQYERGGGDRMRSKFFGNEAGTYTYTPPSEVEAVEWNLCDWTALAEWLAKNPKAAEQFVYAHFEQFGSWWLDRTGEVPDGIARVKYTTIKPGQTRLAVKDQVVFDKLGEGNVFEQVNRFMLGDGSAID